MRALWAETERVLTLQLSSQVVSGWVFCPLGRQIPVTEWSGQWSDQVSQGIKRWDEP
jgi:hypothetical protein